MNGAAIVPLQHVERVDEVVVVGGMSSNLPFAEWKLQEWQSDLEASYCGPGLPSP